MFVLTAISAVSKIVKLFQTLLRFCVSKIRENEILFFEILFLHYAQFLVRTDKIGTRSTFLVL